MSTGSPTAYLLWAILSSIFLVFLIVHLWLYDRFNCVKWDSGRQPGAFRRVMTYSYLATVPLLVVFSVAMTVIKFQEGYFVASTLVMPQPLQLWSDDHRRWVFPLSLILSIAWSLESVTHLEELAFWLFLLHQGPEKRAWFESWEYKSWCFASLFSVTGMPFTAFVSRGEIERTQAWIFLVGSIASTLTTLSFLYVLIRFPKFVRRVKQGGAEPEVVVRLATFFNLNRIRVVFRFLFTIPLLTIGADALIPPYRVTLNQFALDFLLLVGGIGCFVSSAITLFIFFPRSIIREAGYTTKPFPPQKIPIATLPGYYYHEPPHHISLHEDPDDHDPAPPRILTHLPHNGVNHSHGLAHAVDDGSRPQLLTGVRPPYEMYGRRMSEVASTSGGDEPGSSPEYEYQVDDMSSMPSARSSSCDVHPEMTQVQEERGHGHRIVLETQATLNTGTTAVVDAGSGLKIADSDVRSSSGSISRSRPDTPFPRTQHMVILRASCGSLSALEDGHMQRQRPSPHRIPQESTSVSLHPYLMNWTTPIDLLDRFHNSSL